MNDLNEINAMIGLKKLMITKRAPFRYAQYFAPLMSNCGHSIDLKEKLLILKKDRNYLSTKINKESAAINKK